MTDPAAACVALVREAVAWRRAHAIALRQPPEERGRLPELDLRSWYERADVAVTELDG